MATLASILVATVGAPLGQAAAQTTSQPDDLDRMAPAMQPGPAQLVSQTPPTGAGWRNSSTLLVGDVADFAEQRKAFVFAPPGAPPPDWLNRLYLDDRSQADLGPDLRLALSDRLNLISSDGHGLAADNLRNDLREAYVTWAPNNSIFIDLGRINLRNGVAFGFNPTDLFKTQSVLDFDTADASVLREDRLGSFMIRAQGVSEAGSLTLAYSPRLADPTAVDSRVSQAGLHLGRTNGEDRVLVKLGLKLPDDFTPEILLFRSQGRWRSGLNITRQFGAGATTYLEWAGGPESDLWRQAERFAAETGEFPQSAATPLNLGADRFRSNAAAGAIYTTSFKMTLTAEYDYHEAGFSKADWSRWFDTGANSPYPLTRDALWYVRGYAQAFQEPVARQSGFVRVDWDDAFIHNLSLSALTVADFTPASSVLQLSAGYAFNGGISIGLLAFTGLGPRRSEFGSAPSSKGVEISFGYYPK